MAWVCTKCGEKGEVDTLLLNGNYGSGRCHSKTCKHARRLFKKEAQ